MTQAPLLGLEIEMQTTGTMQKDQASQDTSHETSHHDSFDSVHDTTHHDSRVSLNDTSHHDVRDNSHDEVCDCLEGQECTCHDQDDHGLIAHDLKSHDLKDLDDELIYCATQILSALADSTRFKILVSLAGGEKCVCDLEQVCSVSQSAISHQLRLLRDRNIVIFRKEGQRAIYSLADDHVRLLIDQAIAHAKHSKAGI